MKRIFEWLRARWPLARALAGPGRSAIDAAQAPRVSAQDDIVAAQPAVDLFQGRDVSVQEKVDPPRGNDVVAQAEAVSLQGNGVVPRDLIDPCEAQRLTAPAAEPALPAAAAPPAPAAVPVPPTAVPPAAAAAQQPGAGDTGEAQREGAWLRALWQLFLRQRPTAVPPAARQRLSGLFFVGATAFVDQVAAALLLAPQLATQHSAATLHRHQGRAHFWFLVHKALSQMTELAADSYLHEQGSAIAAALEVVQGFQLSCQSAALRQPDAPPPAELTARRLALSPALLILDRRDERKHRQRQRARRDIGQPPVPRTRRRPQRQRDATALTQLLHATPATAPPPAATAPPPAAPGMRRRIIDRLVGPAFSSAPQVGR